VTTSHKQTLLFGTITALILYGSLYPFDFRLPANGRGAWHTLLSGWSSHSGRADFVANILLYMPFGWFGMGSLPRQADTGLRLALVAVTGAVLSVTVELAQYFDVGRVTSASDVCGNLLGTVAGSLCFAGLSGSFPVSPCVDMNPKPVPIALIAFWAGYRFYPYVPTTDVHRYWIAVSPVFYQFSANIIDVAHHTAVWMMLFFLNIIKIKTRKWIYITILFLIVFRVILIDIPLSLSEIMGAVAAAFLSQFLRMLRPRQQAIILFVGLWSITIIERLQPFQWQPTARDFGWLPFRSLLAGSIDVAVPTFCEKTFLYGSLLFLLGEAGCGAIAATMTVSGSLFATSWLETRLPGRSAEITDAVMALLLAVGIALAGVSPYGALPTRFRFWSWSRVVTFRPSEQRRSASCSPSATPPKPPRRTTG